MEVHSPVMRKEDWMIQSIELQNFQSHEGTKIDLAKFTAIVGPSSSGKTAVIRALLWLTYGEWDELYPANPEKPTAVRIVLNNGTSITRWRHGDDNKAIVAIAGEAEPRRYKDFGYIIPGLFDLINFRPIQSGKQKVNLNFSTQDEPMFMLSDAYSKPARAQWLGRLYGAHVVNNMLRIMAKDKKDAEASVRALQDEQKGLLERLGAFSDLEAKEAALANSEALLAILSRVAKLRGDLEAFRARLSNLRGKKWALTADTSQLRIDVEKLGNIRIIKENLAIWRASLASLKTKKALISADISSIRASVEKLSAARAAKTMLDSVTAAEARLASKRKFSAADTTAMRRDVDMVSKLKDIVVRHRATCSELAAAERKAGRRATELEDKREALMSHLCKDGKCVLCRSDASGVSAEDAVERLKLFVGV